MNRAPWRWRAIGVSALALLLPFLVLQASASVTRTEFSSSNPPAKLDAVLRTLSRMRPGMVPEFAETVALYPRSNGYSVGVLMVGRMSPVDIRSLGGEVVGSAGGGVTVAHIPVRALRELESLPGLTRAEASLVRRRTLDAATPATLRDAAYVRTGLNLTGKDVVVAVIDTGIDVTHPAFRRDDGSTRMLGYFDAESTTSWTSEQINAAPEAAAPDSDGHGTHVAGIAAGNGRSADGKTPYVGLAPDADLLIVRGGAKGFADGAVLSGVQWISDQVKSLRARTGSKHPVVINMSLGSHIGPHDGTSLYERSLADYIRNGIPIVVAAGNEFQDGIHRTASLAPGESADLAFVQKGDAGISVSGSGMLDIWYTGTRAVSVEVLVRGETLDFDGGRRRLTPGSWGEIVRGESAMTIDSIDAGVAHNPPGLADELGGDGRGGQRILVSWKWSGGTLSPAGVTLRLHGDNREGSIEWHAYLDDGIGLSFRDAAPEGTIGSPATVPTAIAVASYISKPTSDEARLGDISAFSSAGPMRNQGPSYPKPDIAAPGDEIIAARTRGHKDPPKEASDYVGSSGTSMASPAVAGGVALLLQAHPDLTPAEIQSALRATAVASGDPNRWGAGKVDIAAALRKLTVVPPPPPPPGVRPVVSVTAPTAFVRDAGGATGSGTISVNVQFHVGPWFWRVGTPFADSGAAQGTPVPSGSSATISGFKNGETVTVHVALGDASGNLLNPSVTASTTFTVKLPPLAEDIDGDSVVNIVDLVLVAREFGASPITNARADVNGDGVVNIVDLVLVARQFGVAASPSLRNGGEADFVARLIAEVRGADDGSAWFREGIAALERLAVALRPNATALLPNYPNPFNPETWIPFHLAEPSTVEVLILRADGLAVRRLSLGSLLPGAYISHGRAAHWDGTDELGEPVASGLYFYELRAGAYREARRMLVRK
ncbi:hypothetical protein FJZ36_12070 [Candidatus Poribacteria bacterium]|nr:hypothetical protein [Candidatus Poribacteria bacterium]